MPSDPNAEWVAEFLRRTYGLTSRRVPEAPPAKTADLIGTLSDGEDFACEVKTFEHRHDEVPADGQVHCLGRDNGPERVGRAIHEAHGQLAGYSMLRAIVFRNRTSWLDVLDLQAAFDGFLDYATVDGRPHHRDVGPRRVARGTIADEKWEIDAYIWIDDVPSRNQAPTAYFRVHSARGAHFLSRGFGWTSIAPGCTREDA